MTSYSLLQPNSRQGLKNIVFLKTQVPPKFGSFHRPCPDWGRRGGGGSGVTDRWTWPFTINKNLCCYYCWTGVGWWWLWNFKLGYPKSDTFFGIKGKSQVFSKHYENPRRRKVRKSGRASSNLSRHNLLLWTFFIESLWFWKWQTCTQFFTRNFILWNNKSNLNFRNLNFWSLWGPWLSSFITKNCHFLYYSIFMYAILCNNLTMRILISYRIYIYTSNTGCYKRLALFFFTLL